MSPRHQVFMELLHTEMNYVEILETIVEVCFQYCIFNKNYLFNFFHLIQVFKKPLEDPNQVGGPLLDPTEVKIIFGNLPPIHDIHFELLVQLKNAALNWREDISVGALILKHVSLSATHLLCSNYLIIALSLYSLMTWSKPTRLLSTFLNKPKRF